MLDMQEVSNTIQELEQGPTTFENCRKLAVLYIVQQHYKKANSADCSGLQDEIVTEYKDILPSYTKYCEAKKKFQLLEVPKEKVLHDLEGLCKEIQEFLYLLYTNTDSPEERELIASTIGSLYFS